MKILPKKIKGTKDKQNQSEELPRNSRFITEKLLNFSVLLTLIYLVCLTILVFLGITVFYKWQKYQDLKIEQQKLVSETRRFEAAVKKYPFFKEGYLKLAILEYRLGNNKKIGYYLQKALLLDPEYKDALEFAKKVGIEVY